MNVVGNGQDGNTIVTLIVTVAAVILIMAPLSVDDRRLRYRGPRARLAVTIRYQPFKTTLSSKVITNQMVIVIVSCTKYECSCIDVPNIIILLYVSINRLQLV